MNKIRLEALSDGVFAIVVTLIVIEIKVPEIHAAFSEKALLHALEELLPLFIAYFLSFAVLTNYWTTHNFLFSIMAKNVNRILVNLNFLLLAFIGLIPFSTILLGEYPNSQSAIAIYSLNVFLISVLYFLIREYVRRSRAIENPDYKEINITSKDRLYGTARIIISVLSSVLAIVVSFWSTSFAIVLLLIPVIFGAIPGSLGYIIHLTRLDRLAKEVNN